MSELSQQERTMLLIALQNGIGLSAACELAMLDVRVASQYIQANKEYHASCIQAIRATVAGNLEFMSKLKKEKKYAEWQRQQEKTRQMITELTFWESHCKRSELTDKKLMLAAHQYKNQDECATALGMTKKEFVEYIMNNEALSLYFMQAGLYNY